MPAQYTVQDWPWEHVMRWFRVYGPSMKKLAFRGDDLAIKTMKAYFDGYKDPRNMDKQRHLRACLNDYVIRELSIQGRAELLSQFGHHEEEQDGKAIIVADKLH